MTVVDINKDQINRPYVNSYNCGCRKHDKGSYAQTFLGFVPLYGFSPLLGHPSIYYIPNLSIVNCVRIQVTSMVDLATLVVVTLWVDYLISMLCVTI